MGEGGVGKNNVCSHRTTIQLSLTARTVANTSDFRGIAADVALIENGTICRVYADRTH